MFLVNNNNCISLKLTNLNELLLLTAATTF